MPTMEKEFMELLEEKGVMVNEDKAVVDFEGHSVWITQIDDEGGSLYGKTYYSAYDAYERLIFLGAIESEAV